MGEESSESPEQTRMIVRVQAGELGELAFSVDRTNSGLRVLIGVESTAARTALAPERATLIEVLRANGMAVDSVSVVAISEVGTVLAPVRSGVAQVARTAVAPTSSEDVEQQRKRNPRKLNLTG
jgi:hypothetical protein